MTAAAPAIDRPELPAAAALASTHRLFRLTPYWRVGCLASRSPACRVWRALLPIARHRQPPLSTVAVLVLGVPLYTAFVVWMLNRVDDITTADLRWRMWLAGSWILLSPGLIVAWERRFIQLHSVMLSTAQVEGWNVDRLISVDRIFAKLWWPFVGPASVAVPAGYLTGINFMRERVGAAPPSDPYFWIGLATVTAIGASFGVGVWGVAKTLVYAWVAIDSDITVGPDRRRNRLAGAGRE